MTLLCLDLPRKNYKKILTYGNIAKTKIMVITKVEKNVDIEFEDTKIEQVNEF
jgi:hypothetical protein